MSDAVQSTTNKESGPLIQALGPYHFLHTILQETPNGVLVTGLDHRVIHANPAAGRFCGVAFGKLVGKSVGEILCEKNSALFALIMKQFQAENQEKGWKIRQELDFSRNGQRSILFGVVVYPPALPDYYLLYLIDITQQKTLEGELRRRNAFFHNLIDSSVDGIIASDMKGQIVLFNSGAQALLGYDEEDTKTLHVTKLYNNDGVAYELIKRMRSDGFGGRGKLLRQEMIVKHKNGQDIPVSFSGGIIYDRDQEIATFGLFTDLRAMQQIEESLEQTHRMLMHSEKMAGLGRLAAGVAHEINNPMSGIMLYANLVQEELGEDHPVNADLQTIIHEAERCKVIVADLLEFSHQNTYEMELVELNDVIQKTLTILQHQPLFQNIVIIRQLDPELPAIYGNATRLNQVVMNIVVNAAQAMDGKGRLRITSRTRSNKDINEISIEDTGPGIEEDLLEKIFEPFFTTKALGEGTGLGLSVSYAIIKEHKGSIRVTSTSKAGTTFTLKFPVVMENLIGENHG
ncbi:MAG: PAS domain S-box protein [Proteobacteria bacterium]|nr:PAS domain S-box protein [Pseudomonadota bacterium]